MLRAPSQLQRQLPLQPPLHPSPPTTAWPSSPHDAAARAVGFVPTTDDDTGSAAAASPTLLSPQRVLPPMRQRRSSANADALDILLCLPVQDVDSDSQPLPNAARRSIAMACCRLDLPCPEPEPMAQR